MVLSKKCPILGVDNVKLLGLSSMKVRQNVAPKMIPLPQCVCKWESYFCAGNELMFIGKLTWCTVIQIGSVLADMCLIAQSTRSGIENNLFPFHSVPRYALIFQIVHIFHLCSVSDVFIFDDGASIPFLWFIELLRVCYLRVSFTIYPFYFC
jgi:hypothetical protein